MILEVLKIATSTEHLIHPCNSNQIIDQSIEKRVAGVALFVLIGIATLGIASVFYLATAVWKYQARIKGRVPPEVQPQNRQLQPEPGYDLDQTINKVKGVNNRLCLFIGRTPRESLPANPNETWVSLDIEPCDHVPAGRLHLSMDFNDRLQRQKIEKLFDKVVVDYSTIKFLGDDPWRDLGSLVKPLPTSTIITESWPGAIFYVTRDRLDPHAYKAAATLIPLEEYATALDQQGLRQQYLNKTLIQTRNYLRTLFDNSEYVVDKPFPYENPHAVGHIPHYILRGPRTPSVT